MTLGKVTKVMGKAVALLTKLLLIFPDTARVAAASPVFLALRHPCPAVLVPVRRVPVCVRRLLAVRERRPAVRVLIGPIHKLFDS